MRQFTATKAQRLKLKARIGLTGATNTGKTYTALRIAAGLLVSEGYVTEDGKPDWSKIAVIDTERDRSLFYANDGTIGEFLHIHFEPPYDPKSYIDAVTYAESLGVQVCIIDSLSHAWNGTGGVLEIVSELTEKSKSKNQFNAGWGGKEGGTALQNSMVNEILSTKMHTICTFRQKMEYVQEKDEMSGRTIIRKVGTKAVQRDDLEYEFDITLKLDNDHSAEIIKNTVKFLGDKEESLPMITEEFGKLLGDYLNSGIDVEEYQKVQKEQIRNNIKALGTQFPPLYEYFKTSNPGKTLDDLSLDELKALQKTFNNMLG